MQKKPRKKKSAKEEILYLVTAETSKAAMGNAHNSVSHTAVIITRETLKYRQLNAC
jgi:hypothetical protein